MDTSPAAGHPAQAVEAGQDHVQGVVRHGRKHGSGPESGGKQPALVAQQCDAAQQRADPVMVRQSWPAPSGIILNVLSNRPVRTRMPGGVAGVQPRGLPPMPMTKENYTLISGHVDLNSLLL